MVSNKKASTSTLGAGITQASVLVSPMSAAHRNKMLEGESGVPSGSNWMREQWVANLKKKRMASAGGDGGVQMQQQGLTHPAMFFDDLGCFEIESQSFTRLTPSAREFENLLTGQLSTSSAPVILNDCSGNVNSTATVTKAPAKSRGSRSKALLKKRANSLALDVNQPKPRTPRRKLNCGNAFEDFDAQYASSTQCFSSVGTPSNFSAEMSRMWGGSDLDFATAGSFVDTFLDLPTPNSSPQRYHGDSYAQHHMSRTPHIPIKKNHLNNPYGDAAMGAVDEYFGKAMPSPLGAVRRNSLLSTSAPASSGGGNSLHRLLSSTPRGMSSSTGGSSSSYLRTPRGVNGEYNFDHKNMPEFETLLDEYKFTDIDQELDSFYLDTIESFGGDLDLITN
ncbi:hypothetical protein PybrP1_007698 [[Pythium] brassicae (nom. inval.)]|nr:hypothetical protein PybrP1_007698 [[Pythium] brassicae (nom. inval.)]